MGAAKRRREMSVKGVAQAIGVETMGGRIPESRREPANRRI